MFLGKPVLKRLELGQTAPDIGISSFLDLTMHGLSSEVTSGAGPPSTGLTEEVRTTLKTDLCQKVSRVEADCPGNFNGTSSPIWRLGQIAPIPGLPRL
jgi:hypothetical protein